jgi:hypothetical protein
MRRFLVALTMSALSLLHIAPRFAQEGRSVAPVMANAWPTYPAQYGGFYSGALSTADPQAQDGSRLQFWGFQGKTGDCVLVHMDASDFQPYLQLVRGTPTGQRIAQGAAPLRVERLPGDDSYYIKATSNGSGERLGQYTLALDRC